ncbi:MAG: hypothetical protein H7Y42_17410, partial [Chitinophagaceae bacterium]|nr:hypothetical protein [Chitinophagaceae bacterium]
CLDNRQYLIQLGSSSSKTNYGTIYRRPDTKLIRIEIKFKKKEKIEYILENYSTNNLQQFNKRSLESLVGCINFVTAQSKKNRVKSKYIKQPSWALFLNSEVDDINWSKIHKERRDNRSISDEATIDKSMSRIAVMTNNIIKRSSVILQSEEEVLRRFSKKLGYRLIKEDTM